MRQSFMKWNERSSGILSLILAMAAVIVVFSQVAPAANGQDVCLFAVPSHNVCLFAPEQPAYCSIELFNCKGIELPKLANAPADEVCLFDTSIKQPETEQATSAKFERPFKRLPGVDTRKVLYVYCPVWCQPCNVMAPKVEGGDERLKVIVVKGEPSTFPAFIKAYGDSHGYPVEHWTAPSGKGAMSHGVRDLDGLADLIKTEPDETVPYRQGQRGNRHVSSIARTSNQ